MGITSLQVCMDTSEWLKGVVHEEIGMDSSSPSEEMFTCSRPLLERRVRPQHDPALKCPRCNSTNTKFCYYNNYSLSQPRYFCKACRRYWTKGGSLRNIPVGGGCRKNRRVSVKKSTHPSLNQHFHPSSSSTSLHHATDLHLSFPEIHLPQFTNLLGKSGDHANPNLMENPRQFDFMESGFDSILGNPRSHDFMGITDSDLVGGVGDHMGHGFFTPSNFDGFGSPFSMSSSGNNGNFMHTCQQTLMLPFEGSEDANAIEMKPNKQVLSLEWQDQGCYEVGRDSFGYSNSLGSWTGVMSSYGSSPKDPLI